jgi:hypothetical protein
VSLAVYIAASSREADRVRRAQAMVQERGWTLTLDWLSEIEANLVRGVRDMELSLDEQRRHAQADLDAIRRADAVWLLAPAEPTKGAWVELGYALARSRPVVVSGPTSSIFEQLGVCVAEDGDAPDVLWRLRR